MSYENKSYLEHFKKAGIEQNLDSPDRRRKGEKIVLVLKEVLGEKLKSSTVLDLGCSTGVIGRVVSNHVKKCIGIDPDFEAIKIAKKNKNAKFFPRVASGLKIPFKEGSFDVVICNHIYEHVPDASKMMHEIRRVLKKNGVCYFSAGNRFILLEPHYKLPFLSWGPPWFSNFYLGSLGKGKYEEKLQSYFGVRKLIKGFDSTNMTAEILSNPKKFGADGFWVSFSYFVPKFVWSLLMPIMPTYIYILKK